MIYLTVHDGMRRRHVALSEFPAAIGRSGACAVSIEADSVSARHAVIERGGDEFLVKDQGSTNGLYANGRKVSEHRLRDGDVLYLGECKIEVSFTERLDKTRTTDAPGKTLLQAKLRQAGQTVATLALSWLILLASAAFNAYLDYWPPEQPLTVPGEATKAWFFAAGIALVCSLVAKLTTQRFYFQNSLVFLSLIVAFLQCSTFLRSYAASNIPAAFPVWWPVAVGILLIPLVAGALRRPLQMWQRRARFALATALVALVVGADSFYKVVNALPEREGRTVELAIALPWSLAMPKPLTTQDLGKALDEMTKAAEAAKQDVLRKDRKNKLD